MIFAVSVKDCIPLVRTEYGGGNGIRLTLLRPLEQCTLEIK